MASSDVARSAGTQPDERLIRGTSDPRTMPLSFQEFAAYWCEHAGADRAPPLDILDARDAPPFAAGGIVFDAVQQPAGGWHFAVRFAGEAFAFFFQRDIVGNTLEQLFSPAAAQTATERYGAIMDAKRPSYSNRRRSWIPGRELVWVERIYAPFTDTKGEPVYLAGLSRLSYA